MSAASSSPSEGEGGGRDAPLPHIAILGLMFAAWYGANIFFNVGDLHPVRSVVLRRVVQTTPAHLHQHSTGWRRTNC